MSHMWTDTKGTKHAVRITRAVAKRLKQFGVCDLAQCVLSQEAMDDVFVRLAGDAETIVNFAYLVEHEQLGTEEQQDSFAGLLYDEGSDSLIECGEALQAAVVDFFPASRREYIRQLWKVMILERSVAPLQDGGLDQFFDLGMRGSGSNGCAESSAETVTA